MREGKSQFGEVAENVDNQLYPSVLSKISRLWRRKIVSVFIEMG
jgi:hypothetical protein